MYRLSPPPPPDRVSPLSDLRPPPPPVLAGSSVTLSSESQQRILVDLMTSLERQLSGAPGRPRLLNILAELVMMLTARWKQ